MGTITINPTVNQSNKPWTLTWKASGRYPIVADRIYETLAQAQAYVDDKSATASAIPGLVISVVNDSVAKNNGVYYVESIANSKEDAGFPLADKGVLVKVGGTETETAKNYTDAVKLSQTLVTGQLIKVTEQETVTNGEGESQITNTYKAGFYIVETPGTISALDTSTGAADEIGALKTRVDTLESNRVKVSDFETYKTGVNTSLEGKANATDLTTHTSNEVIHVTSEDKVKWNNAETNANAYTDSKIGELSTVYDAKGAAATAKSEAINAAETYTNTQVGVYATDDAEAYGLRKEIADRDAQVLADAKSYTNTEITALDSKSQGYANTAKSEANTYTDGKIKTLEEGAVATNTANITTIMGEGEGSIKKALADAKSYADQAETDAVNTAKDYINEVVGNYTNGETVATGLRKEIEDKIAAVEADAKSYSVVAVTGDELSALGANVKEAYKLVDEDSTKVGEYIKIYKDSALQKVELNEQSLEFTYLLTDGTTSVVPVDVSKFLAESEFSNGLQVIDHVVSVKVDGSSESFLSVGTDGLKLDGVQSAIDTAAGNAQSTAKAYTDAEIVKVNKTITDNESANTTAHTDLEKRIKSNEDAISVINGENEGSIKKVLADAEAKATELVDAAQSAAEAKAIELANTAESAAKTYADGLNTDMNTRVEALEAIDHDHENMKVLNGITAEKVANWDAAEQNAKDYADDKFVTKEGFNEFEAEYEEKLNGIAAGAEVNIIESIKVNGINATITNKEAELDVTADKVKIGTPIMNGEEEKYDENASVSVVLQGIQNAIRGAIAGGVNSVGAGDNVIKVNSADANNPQVSLSVETATEDTVADGHIELIKGVNGLYGVMYYDGDDAE